MHFSTIVSLAVFSTLAAALPTAQPNLQARDCSAEIEAFNLKRMERRGLSQRSMYPGIQNFTCVLSPETPKLDYLANPPVKSDVTDGQTGVPFVLDIGVMDTTTCQPITNSMVEIWGPNNLGNYGDFLRGATPIGSNGIAEFTTIFPGHPVDGANHVNIAVHQGSALSTATAHVGQLFFVDQWTTIINQSPIFGYNANTHTRLMNAQDSHFNQASQGGFSPIVNLVSIGDDWPSGVLGYITVGVNPTKSVA